MGLINTFCSHFLYLPIAFPSLSAVVFEGFFPKSSFWHISRAENMAVFLLTVKYSFPLMIICFSFCNNLLCSFYPNIYPYTNTCPRPRPTSAATGRNQFPGHLLIWMNMRLLLLLWKEKKKQTQQFPWEFMQCEQNTSWQNGEPRNSSLVALLGKLHFKFLAQGFVWLAPGKLFNIFINLVGALEPTLIEEDHPLNAICHQQFYFFQLNLFSVSPLFSPIPPNLFLADCFPVISNILWLLRYSGAAGC